MGNYSLFASVQNLWNMWELSTIMLISLFLQFFLVLFANQRKHTVKDWQRMFIWLANMSADWVAITALGVLARSETNPQNPFSIPAFWAPILLLHLGGPDTITAYSTQDNDLWLRHLFQLIIEVGLAFYVLFKFWSNYTIAFVAIPVFIAGIIKYGERTWALRSASFKVFRYVTSLQLEIPRYSGRTHHYQSDIPEAKSFREAYFFFQLFKPLFTDLLVNLPRQLACYLLLQNKNAAEAFKLIEVELSLMYDVLYTKRTLMAVSLQPIITLRFISFLCSISALVGFSLTINKHPYSKADTVVSYILLGGAVFLEIYSAIMLAFSDWAMVWLSCQGTPLSKCVFQVMYSSRLWSFINDKRWSSSMAQHDLITAALGAPYPLKNSLGRYGNIQRWEDVGIPLKTLIFDELSKKRSRYDPGPDEFNLLRQLLAERGDGVLSREGCLGDFGWSVVGVEFNHSLLTWHLATNLCYFDQFHSTDGNANTLPLNCRMSKSLSDYMIYLLVDYPFMLPDGIAEPRYRQTKVDFESVRSQFWATSETNTINWGATSFLRGELAGIYFKDMSAVFDGYKLAFSLQLLDGKENWSNEKRW